MFALAKGHAQITLALTTLIPILFFYSLLYYWIVFLIPANVLLLAGHLYFFRDPSRDISKNSNNLIAPADGKIFEILPDVGIIRIRMSLFNVHVNRWPISGTITKISNLSGKHWPFLSFIQRGTNENSKQTVELRNEIGTFQIVQIVGMIARRCIIYGNEEEKVEQGRRMGMIRYGSEVDLHFPKDKYKILVQKNDKTKAGISLLAEYKEG
ncbi:MAG: phosphatidylserine decarboxylase [Candidatus Hodarchaeales archaeon]|jgi:phosphatidylserine decarboxylase